MPRPSDDGIDLERWRKELQGTWAAGETARVLRPLLASLEPFAFKAHLLQQGLSDDQQTELSKLAAEVSVAFAAVCLELVQMDMRVRALERR